MLTTLMQPWTGFTFTDAIDFAAPVLIVVTLAAIPVWHFRTRDAPKSRLVKVLFCAVATAAPLPFLVALNAQWSRATLVLGHVPRSMIDDLKIICRDDLLYQHSCSVTNYAQAFSGWLFYTSLGLLVHLWRGLGAWEKAGYTALLVVVWFLFSGNDVFNWWLDWSRTRQSR